MGGSKEGGGGFWLLEGPGRVGQGFMLLCCGGVGDGKSWEEKEVLVTDNGHCACPCLLVSPCSAKFSQLQLCLMSEKQYTANSDGNSNQIKRQNCPCRKKVTMWCRPGHSPAAYLGSRPCLDSLQVQPGPSWRGLLLTPNHPPSWLQALLSHLQGRPDTALAQHARQLVVSLLSVAVLIGVVAACMLTAAWLKAAHD